MSDGSDQGLLDRIGSAFHRRGGLEQTAAAHPHVFHQDDTAIVSHVEPVVRHFAADGLTRRDYFKAVAADPSLVLQKPDAVIGNLEAVMKHYDADRPMRRDYLQAAVAQPILLRTPPEAAYASIVAAADRLEAHGFQAQPQPTSNTDVTPAAPLEPEAVSTGPPAHSSPLPSPLVRTPCLYTSCVDAPSLSRWDTRHATISGLFSRKVFGKKQK